MPSSGMQKSHVCVCVWVLVSNMSHIVKAKLVCPDVQSLESCLILPRNTHTHQPKHTMSYQIDCNYAFTGYAHRYEI